MFARPSAPEIVHPFRTEHQGHNLLIAALVGGPQHTVAKAPYPGFEQVLSARQIDPAEYPDDLPGVRRFRDGMLRTAHEGSYEQIVTVKRR